MPGATNLSPARRHEAAWLVGHLTCWQRQHACMAHQFPAALGRRGVHLMSADKGGQGAGAGIEPAAHALSAPAGPCPPLCSLFA